MKLKKGLLICTIMLVTASVSGCNQSDAFYFDFSKFLLSDSNNFDDDKVKLEGLNLNQAIVSKDKLNLIKTNVDELFKYLTDKDYYYNNFNNNRQYFSIVKSLLSNEYYAMLCSGETKSSLKKAIDNIYYNEHTEFKSANIIAIEQSIDSLKCYIEVISVNDDVLFNSEIIALTLDDNLKVLSDEVVSTITSNTNTINPLGENSLLQTSHNDFKQSLSDFFLSFTSPQIYDEMSNQNSQEGLFKLNTMINNIKLNNKTNDTLIQLFKAGKGSFKNYAITSYKIDDYESMAITTYTVIFSVNGEIEKYEFEYSRILKNITKISKRD